MIRRRPLLGTLGALAAAPLAAHADEGWHDIDVQGVALPLEFALRRASDGKLVTAADYRGHVVLLYFGYTYCPDVCPLTMQRITKVLGNLGKAAKDVQVLFVTVDPGRDSLKVLKQYAAVFGPQVEGLRGTPDALATLAQRYHVAYSVTPATKTEPEQVTHSSAIYVFDRTGAARLMIPSLASTTPDIPGVTDDLRRLLAGTNNEGIVTRILDEILSLV